MKHHNCCNSQIRNLHVFACVCRSIEYQFVPVVGFPVYGVLNTCSIVKAQPYLDFLILSQVMTITIVLTISKE